MKTANLILFVIVTGYFIAILSDKAVDSKMKRVSNSTLSKFFGANDSKLIALCAKDNKLNSIDTKKWFHQSQHEGMVEKRKDTALLDKPPEITKHNKLT